jgi:two-component system CheB/CheR fusion protein
VRADAARLQQVIWNVLKNAIKFTSKGGDIFVETNRVPAGRLELIVRDTGVGLDPEILPHIFNAFEQGDARMTRQFGGLGLGLAICKALLNLHEGTIEAESEGPQKGATFRIILKEALPTEAVHHERPLAAAASGPTPLRLLLVEDHTDTAATLGGLLADSGYLVKTVSSAEEAIEFIGTSPVDLIISDIGLPGLSGHELLRHIRKQGPVKAIAISGYGMDEDIRRSLEAGFVDHLTKPVNLSALEQAIRRAVE